MLKTVRIWLLLLAHSFVATAGEVKVTGVSAQQRYPWNGLVDIVVTIKGTADEMSETRCAFAATNSATLAAVPVKSIVQVGNDSFSGDICTRRFLWTATNDVGLVKIDNLALSVDAVPLGCVKLWQGGPYWAECNVGASKPEECGYYFWWGDAVGCKRNAGNNGWISVKDGHEFSFSSTNCPTYCMDISHLQSDGYVDSMGDHMAAHDAATAYLGAPWRMPNELELSALISNCTTAWTMRNGVYGRLVSGKGDYASSSIFLPASGQGHDSNLSALGSEGCYWASTSYSGNVYYAWLFYFSSGYFYRSYGSRFSGRSVRPVRQFSNLSSMEFSAAGVTVQLVLDCRTGVRMCSAGGETLHYDASWYENCERVRITDNGKVVTNGTVGCYTWRPEQCSTSNHVLKLDALSYGQIIGTEIAEFENARTLGHATVISRPAIEPTSSTPGMTAEIVCIRCGEVIQSAMEIPALGYVRNVTARQLWPHNKVALSFTVAEDIGDVKRANEDFCIWCARGWVTNVATRILGDRSAKPGVHRIIWDLEAEGLRFANTVTTFGISEEDVSPGGVQLWENGPYWAECNVGASRPEEYGYYFWWGDAVGYKRNADNDGWISVKDGSEFSFSSGNCPTSNKSNSQLWSAGYIDSSGNLGMAHDAATSHLGRPWRMPTDAEFSALAGKCTTTWTVRNGVYGRLVTGKGAFASKSIFLPATGHGEGPHRPYASSYGYYWSSTPYSDYSYRACYLYFFGSSDFYKSDYGIRYYGQSVRPLRGFTR